MFCPKCGCENEDKAKFCKSCGASLDSSSNKETNETSKSSNNKLIIAVAAIICICIIGAALFMVMGNNSDNGATSSNDLKTDDSTSDVSSDDENRYENFSESEWDQSSYTLDEIYTAHTPEDEKSAMFDQADFNGDGVLTGDEIKEMDYLLKHSDYTWNGPSSGVSLSQASSYFPEASEEVLGHVFEEADTNDDGSLSDSELELFKKVRDHTKKYAVNIKNSFVVDKPSGSEKTGYCADHGRVAVEDGNKCPYCIYMGYSDTRTKTSSW